MTDPFETTLRENMIKVLEYAIEQLKKDTTYPTTVNHGTSRLTFSDYVHLEFVDDSGTYTFNWDGRPNVRSPLPPLFVKKS